MLTYYHNDISVTINGRELIKPSKLTINEGKKYVILGINGIGKTTLINRIVEDLSSRNSTNISERCDELPPVDFLLLQQDITIEENQTCLDFLLSADLTNYIKNLRFLELSDQEDLSDSQLEEYERISNELQCGCWDRFESEAKKILKGLQFNSPEITLTSI